MRAFVLYLLLFSFAVLARAQGVAPPDISARAWLLVDQGSGQTLAERAAENRIEPASLTKLMTAYLTFEALNRGQIKQDQVVPVSEKAWKTSGSRMFIEPKKPVTVEELIHGMIIQSGNDACIALAEAIAGSEEAFAQRMNLEAQRLGMSGTHFVNATGLPDANHYTTARDLAKLVQAIVHDFPEYYPIYSKKEYRYNRITQPNRNRLLWLDSTVDGVKTGHTDSAGYCLIASAKRGPRRLVSVLLGADSENQRAQESQKLLNFGFLSYDGIRLYEKSQVLSQLKIFKGERDTVNAGFQDDLVLSVPKGAAESLKVELASVQPLLAPVQQGQKIASLKVSVTVGDQSVALGEYPVVALETVPLGGIFSRAWDSIRLWMQ